MIRRWLMISASLVVAAPVWQTNAAEDSFNTAEEWLIVPKDYSPEKAWPFMGVSQNQVSAANMAKVPYISGFNAGQGLREPLLEVAKKYRLDPLRIYGTGFSRSGHGLLMMTWRLPHWFAAIAPVCEDMREKEQYGKRQRIALLKYIQQTPVFLWHGDHDSFLRTGRKNYGLMKEAGCPVQFDTYPGGHDPGPIYFQDIKKITDFFDKHVLNPYPKEFVHLVERNYTRAFWADARMGKLAPEADYPVFRIAVKEGNRIVVEANEGILKLDFYLNGKIVDMAKPVTVTWGNKEVYKGPAQSKLTVTLREGRVVSREGVRPLCEDIQELYSQPNETGACDWLYLEVPTTFKDPRRDRTFERRLSIDLGFRRADGPKAARIEWASKRHETLNPKTPKAALKYDISALAKRLPVEVSADVKTFALSGSLVDPKGNDPIRLVPAGEGRSGEIVLISLRITNKGGKDIAAIAKLHRGFFMRYRNTIFPRPAQDGPLGAYCAGILEKACIGNVSEQHPVRGTPMQHIGFFLLNPGGLPKIAALELPRSVYAPYYGVQRELAVKAGTTLQQPVLLVSVGALDPKSDKPRMPDLSKIIGSIKPALEKEVGHVVSGAGGREGPPECVRNSEACSATTTRGGGCL